MVKRDKTNLQSLKKILKDYDLDRKKYISREFQDYGYRLAAALDDLQHKSLYIKLAKEEDRGLLEEAKNFVKGAYQVRTKGKMFMWKLAALKREKGKGKASKNLRNWERKKR